MLTPGCTLHYNDNYNEETYFLVKLLLSSLDVLHLHGFLAHDGTERRLVVFITVPRLGESRYTVPGHMFELLNDCF